MRSLFRLVLLALVLLSVALISALTAMRLAIHGREVAVPDLSRKSPAEARRIAEQDGLQVVAERQYYSPSVPEGQILSQLPSPGTLVRRGWQVRVAESLGPQRVDIPDVVGESERAAEINLHRRGLDVAAVAQVSDSELPANQVVAQSPSANASGISAPHIGLLVNSTPAAPAFVMPNLSGRPLGSVSEMLASTGLHLGLVTLAGDTANPFSPPMITTVQASEGSMVTGQNPSAGQKILEGATVTLQVK
jgi:beta-lactam-binding protein with PASTA domain